MSDDEITVDEAAKMLGMSSQLLAHRIGLGHVPHTGDGPTTRIKLADLLAFEARKEREQALAEFGEKTDEMVRTLAGDEVVIRVPGLMSGRPCFRGTRVPVETLFVNLAAGDDLADILENFPTLDREDCRKALAQACVMIAAAAPVIDPG